MAIQTHHGIPLNSVHAVNCKYYESPCLAGYHGILVTLQFQNRKIVDLKKVFIALLPILFLGFIMPCYYNNVLRLSVSIALQRHCIHARSIKLPYQHVHSSSYDSNRSFMILLFIQLLSIVTWVYLLILLSGDIEMNPGPESVDLSSSVSSSLASVDISIFEHNFSVVHYNVQSLYSKVDILQIELSHFDVIALSETWLSPVTKNGDIAFLNYQEPLRKDRHDNYGGLILYIKDSIPYKRRQDLEIQGLESLWVELKLKNKLVLFGLFYRPPNSNQDINNKIEQSIDLAYDTNIPHIIVAGDFNYNYLEPAGRHKILSIFNLYNLDQVISEPTHYTEKSSSLIDLLFTNNQTNILYSGVGEAFLDQNIRYHCPIYAIFKFDKYKQQSFKRKIWKYDNGNYELLKEYINTFDWTSLKHENINIYAENITDKISELCDKTIPNKLVTIRPADPPWFNNFIRKAIRKRKRAHRKAKLLNTTDSWGNLGNYVIKQ